MKSAGRPGTASRKGRGVKAAGGNPMNPPEQEDGKAGIGLCEELVKRLGAHSLGGEVVTRKFC